MKNVAKAILVLLLLASSANAGAIRYSAKKTKAVGKAVGHATIVGTSKKVWHAIW